MEQVEKQIIDFIRRNHVSTTEVADCLGKSGLFHDSVALNQRHFEVGRIRYSYAIEESNWTVHEEAEKLEDGEIFMIDAIDVNGRAIIGDLVSKYVLLYKRAAAIITNGKLRDAHTLIKENYSIWCNGVSPIGCFNKNVNKEKYNEIIQKGKNIYDGAIAVCDDSGVVIIGKENITEELLEKLRKIEEQEDIWYDCIDRRKMSTFDTVCLKKYLKNN
ncbi:RraA family protein [Anaerosporobacter faecicola]|uniref:RraA family protein n=1 Tax=Anaerosporobacter faecicola TaxID=2718714 RepID=UPI00143C083C|nr:RraA family protein [Anaerosporobacter faecicola]